MLSAFLNEKVVLMCAIQGEGHWKKDYKKIYIYENLSLNVVNWVETRVKSKAFETKGF